MLRTLFQDETLMTWPLVGLIIFVLGFAAVLFYALVGLRNRENREYLSSLPLGDESSTTATDCDERTR